MQSLRYLVEFICFELKQMIYHYIRKMMLEEFEFIQK